MDLWTSIQIKFRSSQNFHFKLCKTSLTCLPRSLILGLILDPWLTGPSLGEEKLESETILCQLKRLGLGAEAASVASSLVASLLPVASTAS